MKEFKLIRLSPFCTNVKYTRLYLIILLGVRVAQKIGIFINMKMPLRVK